MKKINALKKTKVDRSLSNFSSCSCLTTGSERNDNKERKVNFIYVKLTYHLFRIVLKLFCIANFFSVQL